MNSRLVALLAVVVFGVVGGAIWFLQSKPSTTPVVAPSTPAPLSTRMVLPDPGNIPSAQLSGGGSATSSGSKPKAGNPAQPMQEWEVRIDQILNSNAGELQTAQMLINLVPTLPPDGQAEAAQHITNLITDKDYNLVMPMLRNPALGEQVQDVLVTDLMNREDPVKLPALLEVAKIPNHPYHEEALTDLQIFLDEENGDNWAKWQTSVTKYLKTQAAEEAAANAADAAAPTPIVPAPR